MIQFLKWKFQSLKHSWSFVDWKCELIARVFSAVQNNVQVVKTAEEVEHELSQEYISKLTIDNIQIPDPFKLETGWETEEDQEDDIKNWPHIYILYN